MAVDFVLTGTTVYEVLGTVTKIEAIGPGATGKFGDQGGQGGGGGEYAVKNNPSNVTTGNHTVQVGAGGSTNDTWFQDDSSSIICRANHGTVQTGGTGGVGDSTNNGGNGGNGNGGSVTGGGGGGGAGGPNGPGGAGSAAGFNGGGGGGADNGEAGGTPDASNGGYGGASGLAGSARGDGATSTNHATTGTLGAGGGGGYYITRTPAPGSSGGTQWGDSPTYGCGGGGGGGSGAEWGGSTVGRAGGNYGGGGGGGGLDNGDFTGANGGTGGDGLLIIEYTTGPSLIVVLHTDVVDNGLNEIVNDATTIFICSAAPTSYTEASSTYALGSSAISFNSPTNATEGDGRQIESNAITGGDVTGDGTVSHWGVCDATRLLAAGAVDEAEAVTNGEDFSLGAFSIVLPFE